MEKIKEYDIKKFSKEMQPFIDIVKKSKSPEEAFNKIQKIKNVPASTSKEFIDAYGRDGTPMEAMRKFYKDVHNKKENVMKKIKSKKQEASFTNRSGTFKQVDNEGRIWQEIEFDGMEYMVTSIDTTHFNMIPKSALVNGAVKGRPATYHVSEFRHVPEFYSNLRSWLKGGEMIGGKSFDESVEKVEERENMDKNMGNNENIIEISEEIEVGGVILEKGDRVKVLTENKVDISFDQFMKDAVGKIAWATLYTTNPISRTDIKSATIKPLMGGLSISSGDSILEVVLDEGDLEFYFDTLNPTNYIYSAFNPKTEWSLKFQKI